MLVATSRPKGAKANQPWQRVTRSSDITVHVETRLTRKGQDGRVVINSYEAAQEGKEERYCASPESSHVRILLHSATDPQ